MLSIFCENCQNPLIHEVSYKSYAIHFRNTRPVFKPKALFSEDENRISAECETLGYGSHSFE